MTICRQYALCIHSCLFMPTQTLFVEVQIHITKPTWSNHHNIFKDAGVDKKEYSYYKPSTKGLDFEGLVSDLKVYHFFIAALAVFHKHVGIKLPQGQAFHWYASGRRSLSMSKSLTTIHDCLRSFSDASSVLMLLLSGGLLQYVAERTA